MEDPVAYIGVVEKGWYKLFRILYLGWRTLLPILEWWRRAGTVQDMVLLPMLEWWRRAGTMYTVKDIVPGMEDPVAYIGVVEKGWAMLELTVQGVQGHSSTPPK